MKTILKKSWTLRIASGLLMAALVCLFLPLNVIAQSGEIRFIRPIKGGLDNYYQARVAKGQDVYVGANYLFQVMKLRSQSVMAKFEQEVIFPKLVTALREASMMKLDDQASVFVAVALKLSGNDPGVDERLGQSVNKITEQFTTDPSNTPRGHYTNSEELRRYFLTMQFLTKAVFDVKINREWYGERSYLVFPFEAWESLWEGLTKPSGSLVLAHFIIISDFYDSVSGRPDLPNLGRMNRDGVPVEKGAILDYATSRNMPRINVGAGTGVQLIGERFTLTQWTLDDLSRTWLANDPKVTRKKAFETLRFQNILVGRKVGEKSVTGLDGRVPRNPEVGPSYYESALEAVLLLKPVTDYRSFVNSAGSGITALSEQTVLTVKESVLVPKGLSVESEPGAKTSRIYFQPGIAKFVKKLSETESIVMKACEAPAETAVWKIIMGAISKNVALTADSKEGAAILEFLSQAETDPTVTVDVFHFNGQFDKGYLQWGIVPYEASYSPRKGISARGIEMVFFEGWNDQVDKKMNRPLTNEDWREMVSNGKFLKFSAPALR